MQLPLMTAAYFLIVTAACTIGAVSGIGGGVIIKPLMDAIGSMGVSTISFLSGCTVLAMSAVSLLRRIGTEEKIRKDTSVFLALGASVGGIAGKSLFQAAKALFAGDRGERYVGAVQAVLLLAINIVVLLYMLYRTRIRTFETRSRGLSAAIGLSLGVLSSFLGIGGGPINIIVLYFFYAMRPKETALNSLFVILCSQAASLATTIVTRSVPAFPWPVLAVMCLGGVSGSLIGSGISRRISERDVERFFAAVLVLLIGINVYNIIRFTLA